LSALDCKELHFFLDRDGALIVYQEKGASWAGLLAFSSPERAQEFADASRLEVAEIASISIADREAVASLINTVKRRPVRYLLLDLDYATGQCRQVEFEADGFGDVKERQLTPKDRCPGRASN
jgi:hypothetical protein